MQLIVVRPGSVSLKVDRSETQNRFGSGLNRFVDRINRSGPVSVVELVPPLPGLVVPPRPRAGTRSRELVVAAEAVVAVGAWNDQSCCQIK